MRASQRNGLFTALRLLCIGGLVLGGAGVSPAVAGEPDAPEQSPEPPAGEQPENPDSDANTAASVHIRIIQDTGEQLELSDAALQLGVDASIVAAEHRVSLRVDPLAEEQLRLRIGYHRGDTEIIKTQELQTKSRTPAELKGSGVLMSVVVVPKAPRGKIDLPPDNDDPLGGLL